MRKLSVSLGAILSTTVLTPYSLALAVDYKRHSPLNKKYVFSPQQLNILASVCETILPRTDTPGAIDVDCHGFIDTQLSSVFKESTRTAMQQLINAINDLSKQKFGEGFCQITINQRHQCLVYVETQRWSLGERHNDFLMLKQLTAFGYFTSEVGASQVLTYQHFPGEYKAIKTTSTTRNYGSLAYY